MTPTEVKSIVLAWLDYQDHDHTLPGHMGPERIEHFSRKMAEPEQAEPKPAELTAEDFVRVPETDGCFGCYFDPKTCSDDKLCDQVYNELGTCAEIRNSCIYKIKEAAK